MNSEDDILDPSLFSYEGDFDCQVTNLMYHVRLTANDVRNLRLLFADVEQTLQQLAPGLVVKPFGSIVTGLGIKTSDVDCFIQLPTDTRPGPKYVILARNILRRRFRLFTNLFAITTAKVPIVKFLHIPTNCKCDVNFKSPAGVLNSQLIGHLLHLGPGDRVLKLAILIKYWSKVHKITGTNLLASYALTLLVIFYLQLMNILPSVLEMQKYYLQFMVDNWNMGFNPDITGNTNASVSLYELLGGFFKCYSAMNFEENIISPYMGRLLNRNIFKNIDEVPTEFELYKQNVFGNLCKPLKIDSPMCIQDPFEHSRNCSGAVHPRLAMKIKAHFDFAAKMFDELAPEYFLKAILTEDPSRITRIVHEKQKHVFHNKVNKRKLNPRQRKRKLNQIGPVAPKDEPQVEQEPPQHVFNVPIIPQPKPTALVPALTSNKPKYANVPPQPISLVNYNLHTNVTPQPTSWHPEVIPLTPQRAPRPLPVFSQKKSRQRRCQKNTNLIKCYEQLQGMTKSKMRSCYLNRGNNT